MSLPAVSGRRPLPRPMRAPGSAPSIAALPREDGETPPLTRRIAGRYRVELRTGSWVWSPEMYTVLGIAPDDARPSSEPLVRRLHPHDRVRALEAISGACAGQAFALEVHTSDRDGAARTVLLVGEPETTDDGGAVAVEGLCVDLTDARSADAEDERVRALQAEVSQLRTAMASRASIEQAKGILMLLTNCGEQSAFDLLAHISSHTHRKVREVAQDITDSATGRSKLPEDIQAILRDACPPAVHH